MGNDEPIRTRLAELSASMHGKKVILDVLVSGQSNPKSIPRFLRVVPKEGDIVNVQFDQEENYKHLRNFLFEPKQIKPDLVSIVGTLTSGYNLQFRRRNAIIRSFSAVIYQGRRSLTKLSTARYRSTSSLRSSRPRGAFESPAGSSTTRRKT